MSAKENTGPRKRGNAARPLPTRSCCAPSRINAASRPAGCRPYVDPLNFHPFTLAVPEVLHAQTEPRDSLKTGLEKEPSTRNTSRVEVYENKRQGATLSATKTHFFTPCLPVGLQPPPSAINRQLWTDPVELADGQCHCIEWACRWITPKWPYSGEQRSA